MRDYSLFFDLAVLGLIVGCQQSPSARRPGATPQVSPSAAARGEADQLMERGEYAKAAAMYQEAVAFAPDDMAVHFALGTSYSHLGRRAEAAEQFKWAVKRGDPGQDYYRAARQWLVRAGMLPNGAPAVERLDQHATVEVGQVIELLLSATQSKAAPDPFPGAAPK